MYVYLVLIISIPALIFFAFIFSTMIQAIQESINPNLGVDNWATAEHFSTFDLAATVVTNLWTYILGVIILGLACWAWIYTQRKGVG